MPSWAVGRVASLSTSRVAIASHSQSQCTTAASGQYTKMAVVPHWIPTGGGLTCLQESADRKAEVGVLNEGIIGNRQQLQTALLRPFLARCFRQAPERDRERPVRFSS